MMIRFRWQRGAGDTARRLARFRRVVDSALQTPRYGPSLERAGLRRTKDIAKIRSIEEVLQYIEPAYYDDVVKMPDLWRAPIEAPESLPPRLLYPTGRAARTAVFEAPVEESRWVSRFSMDEIGALRHEMPEAIAAPAPFLVFVARMVEGGFLSLPPVSRYLIAFTGFLNLPEREMVLAAEERELLWRVFQVPVFEQYMGVDGRLAGWECEAREGLHLVRENVVLEKTRQGEVLLTSLTSLHLPILRVRTALEGSLVPGPCECGRETPRLVALRRLPVVQAFAARAAAG
ncbi:MAG: hypothetical protein IPM24_17380 [Bryobacterales bacterium]|nr:hypothetical protein [Bryobacterales bacterium]